MMSINLSDGPASCVSDIVFDNVDDHASVSIPMTFNLFRLVDEPNFDILELHVFEEIKEQLEDELIYGL